MKKLILLILISMNCYAQTFEKCVPDQVFDFYWRVKTSDGWLIKNTSGGVFTYVPDINHTWDCNK